MERATDVLSSEHRGIERMLRVLEVAAERLERGEKVPPDVFGRGVDFIRGFADKCHHAKEEKNLFPVLEQCGVSDPVKVMLAEHQEGRRHVAVLAAALEGYEKGDAAAKRSLIENSRAYIALLRAHIGKEDGVLFPMANSALSDAEQEDLAQRFEQVEREEIGEGVHERYHGLIEEMEREMDIAGG
jgi:hemerythrin-like domain-containing protein